MSITRLGSTKQYADNWEQALGGKKKAIAKKPAAKKPVARKKTAKKKATGKKK